MFIAPYALELVQ